MLICLNAMRAGLLTRFMGVLGIITGALLVFPLGSPLPIVQCFWLFMLGMLFLGFWPGGAPPAWASGEAMPWPAGGQRRRMGRPRAGARAACRRLRPEPRGLLAQEAQAAHLTAPQEGETPMRSGRPTPLRAVPQKAGRPCEAGVRRRCGP